MHPALSTRYDATPPFNAAVSADADLPLIDQLANRRRWAWQRVRLLGREIVFHRRALNETKAIEHHRTIERCRGELSYALQVWRGMADWHEALVEREEAARAHEATSPLYRYCDALLARQAAG